MAVFCAWVEPETRRAGDDPGPFGGFSLSGIDAVPPSEKLALLE
jgi:hypothetical protein